MTNLGKMMKQAQELQGRMAEIQDKLAQLEITGDPAPFLFDDQGNLRAA